MTYDCGGIVRNNTIVHVRKPKFEFENKSLLGNINVFMKYHYNRISNRNIKKERNLGTTYM